MIDLEERKKSLTAEIARLTENVKKLTKMAQDTGRAIVAKQAQLELLNEITAPPKPPEETDAVS